MSQILFPWAYIPDPSSGRPVGLGTMFFGLPDLDPAIGVNQITVRAKQEDGSLVNLTQPVDLNAGGVPTYNGSPVILDIAESRFSWKVLNSLGGQVYYQKSNEPLVINGSAIADNSISSDKIISLDGDKIIDGTIDEDKLSFDIPEQDGVPYSGGLTGDWDFLVNPTVPPVTQPEAINFNPSQLGFMVLDGATSLVVEFECAYKLDVNPQRANVTARTLNLAGELGGNARCHWMPKAGDVSVAGGNSSFVYQYTWPDPWQADTAFYAAKSFDHSTQTGGRCDSLTLSDDFTKMWIATDMVIYEYTFGIAGDLSTAVFTSSLDLNAFLPAPSVFSILIGGTASWFRCDGGILMGVDGNFFTLIVKSIVSPPWDAPYANNEANVQPVSQTSFTLQLGTPFDITSAELKTDGAGGLDPTSLVFANQTWFGVPNSNYIPSLPFGHTMIPYDTTSPWADRRGITDFDSPDGYVSFTTRWSTDNSEYTQPFLSYINGAISFVG